MGQTTDTAETSVDAGLGETTDLQNQVRSLQAFFTFLHAAPEHMLAQGFT